MGVQDLVDILNQRPKVSYYSLDLKSVLISCELDKLDLESPGRPVSWAYLREMIFFYQRYLAQQDPIVLEPPTSTLSQLVNCIKL